MLAREARWDPLWAVQIGNRCKGRSRTLGSQRPHRDSPSRPSTPELTRILVWPPGARERGQASLWIPMFSSVKQRWPQRKLTEKCDYGSQRLKSTEFSPTTPHPPHTHTHTEQTTPGQLFTMLIKNPVFTKGQLDRWGRNRKGFFTLPCLSGSPDLNTDHYSRSAVVMATKVLTTLAFPQPVIDPALKINITMKLHLHLIYFNWFLHN